MPPRRLLWRAWDEAEAIVYHTASGDTHLVNGVTAEVLRLLERSDRSSLEIARVLSERLNVELDDALVREVESLLAHLDGIGLTEPVD